MRLFIKKSFLWLLLFWVQFSFSQTPPTISATGDQQFCGDAPMTIATNVSITDPDPGDTTLPVVAIQISEGYTNGADQLSLTGMHPNITAVWDSETGRLSLIGPATFSEYETAIEAVVYETTEFNFTQDKFFSINLGDANYLPSTGHYYFYVEDIGITWTEARDAAATQTYFGLQGYLATLTTQEEAELAGEQSSGTGWIGASDVEEEGTWKWMTGPEAGTIFWIGEVNGTPQNGLYTYWNTGEPNNLNQEHYAHITDPSIGILGSWNDLSNTGALNSNDPYHPKGYIVEFGGLPGEPTINLSVSTRIETPQYVADNISGCASEEFTFTVTTNTDEVFWYASETATSPIHSGTSYTLSLTETTTFWVLPVFSGCTEGTRSPITATVLELPETTDITITNCGTSDGTSVFNIFDYTAEVASGNTANREVRFYENASLSQQITTDIYENTSNPQTIYAEIIDTVNGCGAIAEVTLVVNANTSNNATLHACDTEEENGLTQFDLSLATAELTADITGDVTISYHETLEDALLDTNPLSVNYNNTTAFIQTIYARLQTDTECAGIAEVTLIVDALPQIPSETNVLYCLNDFPQTITLQSGVQTTTGYIFLWSTGEETSEIEINEVGTYTVTVTEIDGCSKTHTIIVSPSNTASFTEIQIEDLSNYDTNTVTVIVSGEGTYVFALDDPNTVYQESNTFENVAPGFHTVYVKDIKNNCGITTRDISVIGYPKFFTPNADGANDTWQIKGISERNLANSQVYIYDRFGKLLRILIRPDDAWDGTINGAKMPSGDYWFSVALEDGRTFNGHFTLKR